MKKLEKIQYAGSNWYIKKETKTDLILIKTFNNDSTPTEVTVDIDCHQLDLPIKEAKKFKTKRFKVEPIYREFDMSIIDSLGFETGKKRKILSYS